jgi:hypothetical protein
VGGFYIGGLDLLGRKVVEAFLRTAQLEEGSPARPSGLYAQTPASASQARAGRRGRGARFRASEEDTAAAEAGGKQASSCGLRAASRPVGEESEGTELRHPPLRRGGRGRGSGRQHVWLAAAPRGGRTWQGRSGSRAATEREGEREVRVEQLSRPSST